MNELENQRDELIAKLSTEGHKLSTVHKIMRINAILESIGKEQSEKRYSQHFRAFI